jgi:hypothetical protein
LAPPKERWKEEDRTRQAIVSTAQEILGQEIVGLAESVRQTASDPERPDSRALASCAEVVTRWNLAGETRTAAQAAATAAWTVALPSQEKLRSALQEILFSFQAAMSVEDSLQAAVKDLTDLADAQRDLASHSESGQERKQETLQDAAAVLEKTLLGLNLPASQKTSTAKDLMEQATKAIAKKSPESSALQEKAASTLDEAKKDLETQIAALSETSTPQTPQERLEALAKLHDEVMKQKTEADTMAANPNAARDAAKALSKDVAKTQQEALGVSPAAAQPLGSAASQLGMEDASASKKAADASPKLAEAASALQKEMDQVRGAMENARQMAQAESALDTAVLQTALGARSTEGESANLEDAAGRFEDASRRLEGIQQSPNLPSDVAGALKAAQEALDAAKQAAEQGGAKGGKDNAAKAQQAMAQAKEAMGQAAGGMPQGGMMAGGKGKPGPPSRSKGGGGKLAGAEPMPDQLIGSGADTQRNAGVVVGALKPGERAAIRQSAQENVPSEYTALVRQYMKNLADEGASK